MKCRDFQSNIPNILDDTLNIKKYGDVLGHLEHCKECYDELEIHYVLKYGFDDNFNAVDSDFVKQLNKKIEFMKKLKNHYDSMNALFSFISIAGHTAIAGAFIYVFFTYFL